jgi:predicted nucleotidyltransferase
VLRAAPAELFAAFGRLMNERRWRWYVFGAQAVIAYGRPRLTADVDVTVEPTGAAPAELITALASHGFALRFPMSIEHLHDARLLPMVHAPTAMPVDLVIAAPGLDEEFLERACLLDLGGVEVPVVSVEDLVAMKILAGRRKDIEDVRGVLAEQRGRMDLDRVRDVLASFEAALDEHKLLGRLERLVRAASR